jgi:hypothetical protein
MKNTVYAIVIVVCFVGAGVIAYKYIFTSGGSYTVDSIPDEEMTWVKCNNPACKAEYQMSLKAYFKYVEEHGNPMAPTAPPLICKECGKPSCFRAEKCTNPDCGIVFFRNSVPNDHADRCPECGHSETQEKRDARKREMEAAKTE